MRQPLLVAALLMSACPGQAQQSDAFPAGPNRDVVAVVCTQCHTAGPIVQLRMGEQGWRRQVQNMILRGAQVGPNDIDAVSSYLADTFGPGVPFPNQTTADVHLAAGSGANVVEGGCALCHGLDRVVDTRRPVAQWPSIVHRMVEIGAPLDQEQTDQVIKYLQVNYAPAK